MADAHSTELRMEIDRVLDVSTLPKLATFTCDIEQDYGARTETMELLEDARYAKKLLSWCTSNELPLTGFVVTSLLRKGLPGIHALRKGDIELHAHSHTHDTKRYRTHSTEEIADAQRAFTKEMGKPSAGYRAPQGVMLPGDSTALSENGFAFSTSIFPAYRHGVFDHTAFPQIPWRWKSGILEYPFATSALRKMLTLSYLKLKGKFLWKKHLDDLPSILIIDSHLHDFFVPKSASRLPFLMRLAYSRNRTKGFELLGWLVQELRARGYTFVSMDELHKWCKTTG